MKEQGCCQEEEKNRETITKGKEVKEWRNDNKGKGGERMEKLKDGRKEKEMKLVLHSQVYVFELHHNSTPHTHIHAHTSG
jgi:hypothetical protein